MSVTQCRAINARLRAAGITVHEYPGWASRGNGQTSAYEGGIVHHTASGYGKALPGTGVGELLVKGRPGLSGPLCNYAGNDDGSITVIAAHPANHAGASGGRSMGPLPTTTSFNRRVLGLEIVYPGTSPMRDAQYRSALVWANAVAAVCGGGDIQRVRAHAETSVTGKWDPGMAPNKTIDMAAFRTAAVATTQAKGALMALTDKQQADLYHRVMNHLTPYRDLPDGTLARGLDQADGSYIVGKLNAIAAQVGAVQGAITAQEARILSAVAADGTHPVDVDELCDALVVQLGPDLGEALVNALVSRLNTNR